MAEHKAKRPDLRIILHVDVPRKNGDTKLADSLILKYASEFREKHWPWKPFPEVYFDPRALDHDSKVRASLQSSRTESGARGERTDGFSYPRKYLLQEIEKAPLPSRAKRRSAASILQTKLCSRPAG